MAAQSVLSHVSVISISSVVGITCQLSLKPLSRVTAPVWGVPSACWGQTVQESEPCAYVSSGIRTKSSPLPLRAAGGSPGDGHRRLTSAGAAVLPKRCGRSQHVSRGRETPSCPLDDPWLCSSARRSPPPELGPSDTLCDPLQGWDVPGTAVGCSSLNHAPPLSQLTARLVRGSDDGARERRGGHQVPRPLSASVPTLCIR